MTEDQQEAIDGGSAPLTGGSLRSQPADCPTCGHVRTEGAGSTRHRVSRGFVYAVGRLAPQFASLGVEKEFAQLSERLPQGGLVELDLLREVLDVPDNRYIARHLCWVFTAQDVDAFVIVPRDDSDLARLVASVPPTDSDDVVHVIVGREAPTGVDAASIIPGLPLIVADQLLSFTLGDFADAIPNASATNRRSQNGEASSETDDSDQFRSVVRRVFLQLTHRAENRGTTDEHRALNYVALRYPPVYHTAMQAHREGKALVGIEARHSHSSVRRLVSVRLTFRQRSTEITERYHCLVDVTEVFPFLVTKFQPTYD